MSSYARIVPLSESIHRCMKCALQIPVNISDYGYILGTRAESIPRDTPSSIPLLVQDLQNNHDTSYVVLLRAPKFICHFRIYWGQSHWCNGRPNSESLTHSERWKTALAPSLAKGPIRQRRGACSFTFSNFERSVCAQELQNSSLGFGGQTDPPSFSLVGRAVRVSWRTRPEVSLIRVQHVQAYQSYHVCQAVSALTCSYRKNYLALIQNPPSQAPLMASWLL